MTALPIGATAPDFTAEAHTGERITLADYRGRQAVVLYFYPRDFTSVCTAQACGFRDAYEDFAQSGAVVIGVSGDRPARHQQFAADKRLPFLLVSDGDGMIRKAYGVPNTLGLIPKRVTFVIDKQGVVRHVFSALFTADRHVAEAREWVRQLAQEG
jgi:peroxiredoxin Q/BCP